MWTSVQYTIPPMIIIPATTVKLQLLRANCLTEVTHLHVYFIEDNFGL